MGIPLQEIRRPYIEPVPNVFEYLIDTAARESICNQITSIDQELKFIKKKHKPRQDSENYCATSINPCCHPTYMLWYMA